MCEVHIAVESIPFAKIPNIPLVGSLKQPFDGVDYVWVHENAGIGLTQEFGCVNSFPGFME
jgi:hypothetical protein